MIVVLPIDAMKFRVEHEHPQEPIFLLCAADVVAAWGIKSSFGSSGDCLMFTLCHGPNISESIKAFCILLMMLWIMLRGVMRVHTSRILGRDWIDIFFHLRLDILSFILKKIDVSTESFALVGILLFSLDAAMNLHNYG